MKKNQLTTAVFAAFAGVVGLANLSSAVNVNPDGTGTVLVYPYYTVNADNDTLVSVVNTANEVKAVKVRFHEAVNSRDTLDFHLYLSPFDVWTAAVTRHPLRAATGEAILITNDNSCTVPQIKGNPLLPLLADGTTRYVEFSTLRNGGNRANTRNGYLEMIEMGVVGGGFAAAATHGGGGTPANCGALVASWSIGGVWNGAPGTNITPPTGGLFGGGSIVNTPNGRMLSYNATAFEGFGVANTGLHQDPALVQPNLGSIFAAGPGTAVANVFVNGRLIQSNYTGTRRVDALSATIAFTNQVNEFSFNAGLNAKSEWVITFPTKRFYTDAGFSAGALAPFSTASTNAAGGCETVSVLAYNREELRVPFVNFSPAEGPFLCAEANVVSFEVLPPGTTAGSGLQPLPGGATPILGAVEGSPTLLRVGIPAPVTEGWANLSFVTNQAGGTRQFVASADGDVWVGLPALGFYALAIDNVNAAPGVRAFYSGAFAHKGARRCENAAGC